MNPAHCSIILVDPARPPLTPQLPEELLQLLQSLFAQVTVCHSGKEALQLIHNRKLRRPILVLVNIDSPGGYSHDLLQFLHGKADQGIIPFLFSNQRSDEITARLKSSETIHFLLKPLAIETVRNLILMASSYFPLTNEKSTSGQSPIVNGMEWSPLHQKLDELFRKESFIATSLIDTYLSFNASSSLVKCPCNDKILLEERDEFLRKSISKWNFNQHELSEQDMIRCACIIFDEIMRQFPPIAIPKDAIHRFIIVVKNAYPPNQYHNFGHALDVLQAVYFSLCSVGLLRWANQRAESVRPNRSLQRLIRPKDILALAITALGHDIGHPGVNNSYLLSTGNPLATTFEHGSALESFHYSTIFHLLKNYGGDIFKAAAGESCAFDELRVFISHSILATDLAAHEDYMNTIRPQLSRLREELLGRQAGAELGCEQEQRERILLCGALIKCSDLSSCTRPLPVHEKSLMALMEEMRFQRQLECILGVETTLKTDQLDSLADSQVDFLGKVVLPLYEFMGDFFPVLGVAVQNLLTNLQAWKRRREVELTGEASGEDLSLTKLGGGECGDGSSSPSSSQSSALASLTAEMRKIKGRCADGVSGEKIYRSDGPTPEPSHISGKFLGC
ncbi:uncharacterized protein VTP21DRAFT_3802 [Calcarisporiella thermophila]|uniref:uncharacterized protein n=1 Tax=Calcarisporiella thermophila TaxID=911321 RepID=UPI003743EF34